MSKKIEFDYENQHYTLEYNRQSIVLMEQNGFIAEEYVKKPMTMIGLAFKFAFYKNHPKTTQEQIDKIFDSFPNKQELNTALISMIGECYDSLIAGDPEKESKNIEWKIV